MKIAFITYRKQEKYSIGSPKDEDKVLMALFKEKGLDVTEVIWNDASVNWADYDKAVLKSPWDYHEYFSEFTAWLSKLETLGVELLNPSPIVRWNSDKHYFKDIEKSGLPVIASDFFEKGSSPQLHYFFEKFKAQTLVIKPCVSASAKHTLLVTAENVSEREKQLHAFLKEESFIVQPFVEEIREGELSLVFFGNQYSHSVIKQPKAGDFRVQHFHGGTIRSYEPAPDLISAAQQYVDKHAQGCLYVRVDGVLIQGHFQLMELELIEPYLYLDLGPGAYERYYEALLRLISK